jgi:hypothetical protein
MYRGWGETKRSLLLFFNDSKEVWSSSHGDKRGHTVGEEEHSGPQFSHFPPRQERGGEMGVPHLQELPSLGICSLWHERRGLVRMHLCVWGVEKRPGARDDQKGGRSASQSSATTTNQPHQLCAFQNSRKLQPPKSESDFHCRKILSVVTSQKLRFPPLHTIGTDRLVQLDICPNSSSPLSYLWHKAWPLGWRTKGGTDTEVFAQFLRLGHLHWLSY